MDLAETGTFSRAFEQRKQLAAREVAGREEVERKAGRHRDRAQPLHLAVRGPHPWYGDCLGEDDFYHSFKHQPPHKSVHGSSWCRLAVAYLGEKLITLFCINLNAGKY